MSQIYTAEITAYDPSIPGTTTLYYASQGYVTKPTDSPANTYYDGRIQQPANVQRSVFDGGSTFGASRVGYGELVLVNNDGVLDSLLTYGLDGRAITVKLGEVKRDSAGAPTWTTVLKGTMEQPELNWETVIIRVRDRQFEISKPLQLNKYAGSNTLPAGLEGVAGDLKGKPKPKLYGTAYNMPVPCVNTDRLIYQISDSLIASVAAVYDKANAVTAGTARSLTLFNAGAAAFTFTVDATTDIATTSGSHGYTTADPVTATTTTTLPAPLAINTYYYVRVLSATTVTFHTTAAGASANTGKVDLTTTGTGTHTVDNNTTISGKYDWVFDSAGSYIRLGLAATGLLTVDASQGAAAANRTVAQILDQMLLDASISSGDISSADVTALDVLCNYEVGYWATYQAEVTFLSAMDDVANSIGAWFGQDRLGVFRMGRIVAPAGTAAATLTSLEIIKLDRTASSDQGKGVPAYLVNLDYKKFWATQTSDFASAVTVARRGELASEYRRVKTSDASVLTAHLLSPEMTFTTLLVSASDAAAEASRRLTLYSTRRDLLDVRVYLDSTLAAALDLGSVITVQVARFGFDSGKKFLVVGVQTDLLNGVANLTLWG